MTMDYVEKILSVASQIHTQVENVQANKNRCQRVCHRVKALEDLVRSIESDETIQESELLRQVLEELAITLDSAQQLIRKHSSANYIQRLLTSQSQEDEFSSLNNRLSDSFQVLAGALLVKQSNTLSQVFHLATRVTTDKVDEKEDNAELKNQLLGYVKNNQEKADGMETASDNITDNAKRIVEMMDKPSLTDEVTRMIRPDELKYDFPKTPILVTQTSEVYKGEYHGFPVAIERYTEPMNTSFREVQAIFMEEVETMKRFESPNILRLFGICVQDEDGPNPQFYIIREFCQKGILREVLDSDVELSWIRKARMCLDAAKGLYRIHQTEAQSRVHGCISSYKFLVCAGYSVKLGGFGLPKTETWLKMPRGEEDNMIRSSCYTSPQMFGDVNHVYSKPCDVYSFGIVLWEIATKKKPFEGLSDQEICQKVHKEKFQESLPDDCPESLAKIINACRAYEDFQRPTAGVLMDKLHSVVAQLEEY